MIWAYLSFSQFMIIWSENLPEEIPWYLNRIHGGWQWIATCPGTTAIRGAISAALVARSENESQIADVDRGARARDALCRSCLVGRSSLCRAGVLLFACRCCRTACHRRNLDVVFRSATPAQSACSLSPIRIWPNTCRRRRHEKPTRTLPTFRPRKSQAWPRSSRQSIFRVRFFRSRLLSQRWSYPAIVSREVYSGLLRPSSERSPTPLYGEGLVLPAEPRLEGIEMMSADQPLRRRPATTSDCKSTAGSIAKRKSFISQLSERWNSRSSEIGFAVPRRIRRTSQSQRRARRRLRTGRPQTRMIHLAAHRLIVPISSRRSLVVGDRIARACRR